MRGRSTAAALSARALATPEPFVRLFARRVQQEGALDLTQGDYKNADFAPHPEVVRAAQRITRNTVHSYGPAVGRMDVRSEVAEFFNRDGLLDYPDSEVRFLPDEVLFTPGTRAGLAIVLEVLGADGTGVVVTRPSWEYDWFIERAGKKVVELPTTAPEFLPDPQELDRLLAKGGCSSVVINNPHNPTGRVYPRALVEELVRVAVKHRCYVLYDSVYQRLDYVGWFVNPAFARPEWRDWVVSMSGLSKMDMFGASTGARACWLVISDQIRSNGIRAREILANLSAWLVATPSTLAQDWALAALQSPLAALRRPSPYMRERRDFMLQAADELAPLGIERTDFGGTFYAPLAFPGLVGEPFDRLRNGVHERAVVRNSVDAFEFLLSGGVGGIPFAAFAGGSDGINRYGTWQRLSYGSKDVKELAVFMDRVRARIERQGRIGSAASVVNHAGAKPDAVWDATCTTEGYDALDGLDEKEFAAARRRFLENPRREALRLTGTKHPDSTAHRAEQVERALRAAPADAPDRARLALTHLEWNPLMEARLEYEESIADLLGPCSEVLLDLEGRQISPDWLDVPEKVVLALLRHGIVPGEDRHVLLRVPNPFIEQDEEKILKILASVARTNVLFHLACERLGLEPVRNAIHEITVPQVNSSAEIGAVIKIGTLYLQAAAGLFEGSPDHVDEYLAARVPAARRAELLSKVTRVRLVPLCENVGALAHLPDLLERFYHALERGIGVEGLPTPEMLRTTFDRAESEVRVFVAMSDTALQSGKIATDAACTLAVAGRVEAERRLAGHAARLGQPAPRVTFLIGSGRAGFRGGFDPSHPGVIAQFSRADGVTLQGIRADSPEGTLELAAAYRAAVALQEAAPDRAHAMSSQRRRGSAQGARIRRRGAHLDLAEDRAAACSVRQPGAADPRPHPGHGLGELRPLDSHVSAGMGRRPDACPTIATCATHGPRASRCPAPSSTTSPARHSDCPRSPATSRCSIGAPPCCSSVTCRATARSSQASCRISSRMPPRSSSGASSPRPLRVVACARPLHSGSMRVRVRISSSRRACSPCSTCATWPRTRKAGTRRRSTRAGRHARRSSSARPRALHLRRSAASPRATAGLRCNRWWTPRTPRGCCSRASSRSRRSASSSTSGSRAGCAACPTPCRQTCAAAGPACASSARTSSRSTPSSA